MKIEEIHQQFYSVLKNYIAKRINNQADVEDLLQDVFIKICRNSAHVEQKNSLKSWLFKITQNTIIDYYRRRSTGRLEFREHLFDPPSDQEPSLVQDLQLDKCLNIFIEQLPDDYRQIMIDSEIKGAKQKDLAFKYKLAYPSLRSRVQRGRAKLRMLFDQCCKISLDKRGNILEAIPRRNNCVCPA